ncbi:hypothetical protein OFP68_13880 [Brachyspira hyodysenteriae]|uniref:hypothetical protein n=1 Tax=Brachyspira hyodysenteriae TaxID=159 RepID=UPI0022CD5424|nr:hypothetical protein [Brachyspira hyodysenteriae]MCZ9879961.1 hypothetical protein [Brachyspira hyodysenteriae]
MLDLVFNNSKKIRNIFDIIRNVDDIFIIDDNGIFIMALLTFNLVIKLIKLKVDAFIDLEVYSRYSSCIAL